MFRTRSNINALVEALEASQVVHANESRWCRAEARRATDPADRDVWNAAADAAAATAARRAKNVRDVRGGRD